MLTVLVLGGYGFFGARIAKALAEDARIRVLIGGRDPEKAADAARALRLPEQQSVGIDAHGGDLAARLRELRVGVVVHTAGPFQTQGYDVAQAAIAAGCHYIDLADGRAFVAGITSLDALARQIGVSVISGASSLPALSSAVVDRYSPRFAAARTVTLHAGIANNVGHLALYALAGLVRGGVLKSPVPLAGSLNRLSRIIEPVVSERGGMFVTLEGTDHEGEALSLTWIFWPHKTTAPRFPAEAPSRSCASSRTVTRSRQARRRASVCCR